MNFPIAEPAVQSTPAISRVGRFYVLRELGRGTTGCVYLAHDPVIGRDIAVKTLHPQLSAIERARYAGQFVNEARAAGLLAHPHIITIHDANIEHGSTYIAMEYLQGRELEKILDSGHRYRPDEVASIIWKLADALDHAHGRQVIHRDVKPANIFMVGDNQPKLVDFGIACAPNRTYVQGSDEDRYAQAQKPGTVAGTPNYMPPEQALGRQVDERADIYSLGVVMYEMLAGCKPFQSDDPEKLLHLITTRAPRAPNEIDPKVPIALSDIAMKAMNRRPERRYQSARALARDLKHYVVRERRTRKRMKIRVPGLEHHGNRKGISPLRAACWITGLSIATAATVAGVMNFL